MSPLGNRARGGIYVSKFTTRVQLDGNPTWDDYNNLHAAMARQGFTQTIADSDGVEYELPHAEYNREGSLTRGQVLNEAKAAAGSVWSDYRVLITESDGRTWWNLKKVGSSAYRR
jgi:hypothetical protein